MGDSLTVTVAPRGTHSLRELLADAGNSLPSDCGGVGTCGKCGVRVFDAEGERSVLACQFVPTAPVAVKSDRVRPVRRVGLRGLRRPASSALRLAADIGTTTISLAAVDETRRRVVARQETLNPQVVFGADVMSRIAAGKKICRAALEPVLLRFMADAGIASEGPVVAVGNTVMAHFLMGRSPASLGEFPYESRLPLSKSLTGQRGGIRTHMLPLLGSFVGSDCTAAILASGMHRTRRLSLLVDAGTNGEVVLGNRERMLVTSTAAGPAFEGATLQCGSLAQRGAVRAARFGDGQFVLDVIGGGEPKSVCGSGVLDAVAEATSAGFVDASGRIGRGARLNLSDGQEPVYLSQADLREVQLAKCAIAAAIRILLAEWGAAASDLECVYVTGKFGAAMNPASAVRIGLLPQIPLARIRRHGNLALLGAVRATLNPDLFVEAERFAANCQEVMLSSHPQFEQYFVDSMRLEPWN
ncbi:MAG: ASKHA domain-containing protein [candidate division WOR-3 bacterium]|nr:ASKHA domain-containing protein [candidate division WOR-3 bacterium]